MHVMSIVSILVDYENRCVGLREIKACSLFPSPSNLITNLEGGIYTSYLWLGGKLLSWKIYITYMVCANMLDLGHGHLVSMNLY